MDHPFAGRISRAAKNVCQFLTAALFVLSLLSLYGRPHLFELLTNFRLQFLLAGIAGLVCCALYRLRVFTALALIALVINGCFVVPFYFRTQPQIKLSSAPVKLMLANVMVGNTHYDLLLKEVAAENPDILVLQEFTPAWDSATETLSATYPFSFKQARKGGAGLSIFSRFPLTDPQVITFDATQHGAIVTQVEAPNNTLTLLTLHPPTPLRQDKFDLRNGQLTQAAALMQRTKGAKILAGDLNVTPWSPYFQDLLAGSELRDARRGYGLIPSWPNPLPAFLRIPLDQCLVSRELAVTGIRTGASIGSDHLPLIVELQLEQRLP